MPAALVARQPIFDRRLEAVGYELLFRAGVADQAVVADAEGATATVMLNSLTEIGVDRLVGGKVAWINVSREFVLDGYARLLPPHLFVLELLEGQTIDDRLIDAAKELKESGHRLALDDFTFEAGIEPMLGLAEFVKLDLLELGREAFAASVERLRPRGLTLLAEKLETYDDYEFCSGLECKLFQGYFFCKPQIIATDRLDANRLSVLQLLGKLQDPAVEVRELEHSIGQDPLLSYRLLRYINSAFFGLSQEVRSLGQAVVLLGLENLKRWATLSLFTMIDGKPAELTMTALARARFCELAAADLGLVSGEMFTIGLLSLLDALLDMSLTAALADVPLAPDIVAALTRHTGPRGRPLECVLALEAGDLDSAEALVRNAAELYPLSVIWAQAAAGALTAA